MPSRAAGVLFEPKLVMNASPLVVVDDHKIMREGLRALFRKDDMFSIVADTDNGPDLFAYLDDNQVDMVLMDIHLPGANGLELAEEIKRRYPQVKIIVHTMSDDSNNLAYARRIGAEGYVLKSSGHKELLDALTAVRDGGTFYSI